MTDEQFRFEIEHSTPPLTALRIAECPAELIDLASAQPGHDIWAERVPGTEQIRYVARRRRGTDAHPYAVVTTELAELRNALPPPLMP